MNFQNLKKVEEPDFYINLALSRAAKGGESAKEKTHGETVISYQKRKEAKKLDTIKSILMDRLMEILVGFPSLDGLPEFYRELITLSTDYARIKKSLASINWIVNKLRELTQLYNSKIARCEDLGKIHDYRNEYYGRVCSLLKRRKEDFRFLEETRRVMKDFPSIKTSVPTVCIFGFPNVGKTTLLYKLTGSKPEISNYSFTTKTINISYIKEAHRKLQVVDTPGTLNRFEKMNNIEKQAYLALKHCADSIVYVFDVTEPYPMEDQEKLFNSLKAFDKKIYIYVSKLDIIDPKLLVGFKHKYLTLDEIKKELKRLVK